MKKQHSSDIDKLKTALIALLDDGAFRDQIKHKLGQPLDSENSNTMNLFPGLKLEQRLSLSQVEEYLALTEVFGECPSRQTLINWLEKGRIRGIRVEGLGWRVSKASLQEFLEKCQNQKPDAPEISEAGKQPSGIYSDRNLSVAPQVKLGKVKLPKTERPNPFRNGFPPARG